MRLVVAAAAEKSKKCMLICNVNQFWHVLAPHVAISGTGLEQVGTEVLPNLQTAAKNVSCLHSVGLRNIDVPYRISAHCTDRYRVIRSLRGESF